MPPKKKTGTQLLSQRGGIARGKSCFKEIIRKKKRSIKKKKRSEGKGKGRG